MPRKFYQSVNYAMAGLRHAFWTQRNIRIHLFIGVVVFAFGLYLKLDVNELVALLLAISFVIMAEMVNTSIEEMINLIVTTHRTEAKIAKDVAAGAVLFSSLCAIIIGLLIFIPHLVRR